MLDESLVFQKTEAGAAEMATPALGLPPKLRRALIVVDGMKSVSDLAPMFRPGEVEPILMDLQARGLVTLTGGVVAEAADRTGAGEAPGVITADVFEEVRRQAMREVSHRLGPNGDALALKIERCRTPEDLRVALREAEKILASFLGAEYGRTFAQKIGRDLL
jgi:hypothetical protein